MSNCYLIRAIGLCFMAMALLGAPPDALIEAAKSQIGVTTKYDSQYTGIPYPGGDVPMDRGVCTDVLIRAYRELGIDLQKLVHEDMAGSWAAYPNPWRMKSTDRSIDHRRVPNLATFFKRHGTVLSNDSGRESYKPGDIVVWKLPQGLPHIGLVSGDISNKGIPLIIHNIGYGVKIEDILLEYKITGHYRYFPSVSTSHSPRATHP